MDENGVNLKVQKKINRNKIGIRVLCSIPAPSDPLENLFKLSEIHVFCNHVTTSEFPG